MFANYPPSVLRAFCRRIYGDRNLVLTPQVYNLSLGDLLTGQQLTRTIQITANADFIGLGLSWIDAGNFWNATVLLSDSSTGEQFSAAPVLVRNAAACGARSFQNVFAYPRFLGGNTSVTAAIVAIQDATKCHLSFHGMLVRVQN